MPNRARDWVAQAERDLEQARASQKEGRHEWACFAAQQAAKWHSKRFIYLWDRKRGATSSHDCLRICRPRRTIFAKRPRYSTTFTSRRAMPTDTLRALRSNITVQSRVMRPSAMPVRSLNSSVLVWPDRSQV